jgi:hypothetical protein
MRWRPLAFLWPYAAVLEVIVVATAPKDFTKTVEPPSFKIDGDVFYGRKKLNGGAAMRFASEAANLGDEDDTTPEDIALMLKKLFRLTLRTSSYRRMAERIDATLGAASQQLVDDLDPEVVDDEQDDRLDEDVLDLQMVTEISEWLLGEYGLRPTPPSSPSSPGPDGLESGTS